MTTLISYIAEPGSFVPVIFVHSFIACFGYF